MHLLRVVEGWTLPPGLSAATRTRVRALALAQHGVVERDVLLAAGLSRGHIERSLACGRWQEIAGVAVLHNTALTEIQQAEVATRLGVEQVALAARTAAGYGGLTGWQPPALEVIVPKGTTYPELPVAVRIHESRRFSEADIVPTSPRRVSIERALVDAASWAANDRTACGLLAAGVQQRLTTSDRLMAELEKAGRIRRRRLLQHALVDIGGGARAMSEIDFLRYCRRHGLPTPAMQMVRIDGGGRRRYLDATFERKDGRLVRVEIDGALHLLVSSYWSDMDRANELVIVGEQTLRFPSYLFHANDPQPAAQIQRALDLSVRSPYPAA